MSSNVAGPTGVKSPTSLRGSPIPLTDPVSAKAFIPTPPPSNIANGAVTVWPDPASQDPMVKMDQGFGAWGLLWKQFEKASPSKMTAADQAKIVPGMSEANCSGPSDFGNTLWAVNNVLYVGNNYTMQFYRVGAIPKHVQAMLNLPPGT